MIRVDVQLATLARSVPRQPEFSRWVDATLSAEGATGDISIRVVDEEESRTLNREYRSKDKPTNVLSFPAELPAEVEPRLLGDIVICAPVVAAESWIPATWCTASVTSVPSRMGSAPNRTSQTLRNAR